VEAYTIFKELIIYYGITQLIKWIEKKNFDTWDKIVTALPKAPEITSWKNIGGQLITDQSLDLLLKNINAGKIGSWDEVHAYYTKKTKSYGADKFQHAFASLLYILKITPQKFTFKLFVASLRRSVITKEWMTLNIYESRAKDYTSSYRQMVYDNREEMDNVLGKLEDNIFLKEQQEENLAFANKADKLMAKLNTNRKAKPGR
jgi:hypothetical protein